MYLKNCKKVVLPGDISEAMHISSARVASILNNLEHKGLVQRQIDKSDRRRILVSLTEAGSLKAEKDNEKVIKQISKMLEHLGEEDANHFVRITSRIIDLAPQLMED